MRPNTKRHCASLVWAPAAALQLLVQLQPLRHLSCPDLTSGYGAVQVGHCADPPQLSLAAATQCVTAGMDQVNLALHAAGCAESPERVPHHLCWLQVCDRGQVRGGV